MSSSISSHERQQKIDKIQSRMREVQEELLQTQRYTLLQTELQRLKRELQDVCIHNFVGGGLERVYAGHGEHGNQYVNRGHQGTCSICGKLSNAMYPC